MEQNILQPPEKQVEANEYETQKEENSQEEIKNSDDNSNNQNKTLTVQAIMKSLFDNISSLKQQLKQLKKNFDSQATQNNSSLQILSKYSHQLLLQEILKHTENVIDNKLFHT